MIGIYKITSPTKRVYIGQSVNLRARILQHKSSLSIRQPRLYASLKKYGVDKHKFEVVCECSVDELDKLEIYYIDLYNCAMGNHGLNCGSGGANFKEVSLETRMKISKAMKGRKLSPEHCKKIGDRSRNRPVSKETRVKLRQINLGKKLSDKAKALCAEASRTRVVKDSTREKLRLINLGKKASPLEKERLLKMYKDNETNFRQRGLLVNSKKVIDTNTGIIYSSCYDACLKLGFKKSTLNQYLAGSRKNKTTLKWL